MRKFYLLSWVGLTLGLAGGDVSFAQERATAAPPPLPYRILKDLKKDRAKFQAFLKAHPAPSSDAQPSAAPTAAPPGAVQWRTFPEAPGRTPLSNPLQMTDGSIIAHASCTGQWYRLAPDINGDYFNGEWRALPLMPGTYAPRFFASVVLSDGRILIEGGEYNGSSCADVESNLGAIYNHGDNTWTAVAPPSGWGEIGNAESIALPNKTVLLSSAASNNLATFNPSTLTWKSFLPSGKTESNNEENWTLLPNGNFVTVEAYTQGGCSNGSAIYESASQAWVSAGGTVPMLAGCSGSAPNFIAPTQIYLIWPNLLGYLAAFQSGASLPSQDFPASVSAFSGIFWSREFAMPTLSGVYNIMADAPAAILPDGSAIVVTGSGEWANGGSHPPPTHVWHFGDAGFFLLANVPNGSVLSSYQVNLLVLPTGDILAVETDYPYNSVFPAATAYPAYPEYAPIVSSAPQTVTPGSIYSLNGNQLAGLTQGAVYGNKVQADTNFPLVRIVNNATKHVFYATTLNFTRNIAVNSHPASISRSPAPRRRGPARSTSSPTALPRPARRSRSSNVCASTYSNAKWRSQVAIASPRATLPKYRWS